MARELTSPLERHKVETHDGKDFNVTCKVVEFENEIPARRAVEAT